MMSRRGANWYQREPHAYLGGVRGLPSKLHAVYSVILDLIYDGGGECPNDPKWISGWFSDLGPASVRRAISDLCDIGKLAIEGNLLTNKRATIQAKTDRETREKRRVFGAKGGRMSGERRAELKAVSNENNTLSEPSVSTQNEAEKRREEKKEEVGGGGSADARDDPDLQPNKPEEPDLLDRVIEAAQIDIQRDRSPQRWFGSEPRHTIEQWQGLDLTAAEIIETVSEVMVSKHDGPPATLSYFNPAMQRRAGLKARPDLMPINGGKPHDEKSARERRAEARLASDLAFARDLDRAAAGGS